MEGRATFPPPPPPPPPPPRPPPSPTRLHSPVFSPREDARLTHTHSRTHARTHDASRKTNRRRRRRRERVLLTGSVRRKAVALSIPFLSIKNLTKKCFSFFFFLFSQHVQQNVGRRFCTSQTIPFRDMTRKSHWRYPPVVFGDLHREKERQKAADKEKAKPPPLLSSHFPKSSRTTRRA